MIYVDNSKAEEYALLAFFCQWICANKRRCVATLVTCDGAGFYQQAARRYSFSAIKITVSEQFFRRPYISTMKSTQLSVYEGQSPVNVERCTRYTLPISPFLSQT
jgi:hypothetical protein